MINKCTDCLFIDLRKWLDESQKVCQYESYLHNGKERSILKSTTKPKWCPSDKHDRDMKRFFKKAEKVRKLKLQKENKHGSRKR